MPKLSEPLTDKYQTSERMHELVRRFSGDLKQVYLYGEQAAKTPLNTYFDFVRNIPYRQDTKPVEVVSRPYHIISGRKHGADCKKKSILIAAWARQNKIPYRFVASSKMQNGKIHHVFPQLKIKGQWINADATYRNYKLGEPKIVTKAEVI